MKILSMTATFGKLEHAKLELQPGLNIIEAPNEWGKSTWCAFLVSMLYGIDTRARTTGAVIADKDRYAPWSGAAMSGRMELEWEGRKITIERSSRGRTPLGEFRAYETETGLDVPELDANNCGQKLLGVERSVFTRAGFLKLTDLPVSQDDALRRRLNNLVTTGDESGAGDHLGQALKDLKNKCRYNNSGLLPQAEAERDQLVQQLRQLQLLNKEAADIRARQQELTQQVQALENHRVALEYEANLDNIRQVEAAEQAMAAAQAQLTELEALCAGLPSADALQLKLQNLEQLLEQRNALFMQPIPDAPVPPGDLGDPEQVLQQAQEDVAAYTQLQQQLNKPKSIGEILMTIVTFGIYGILRSKKKKALQAQAQAICARYPGLDPQQWVAQAESYAQAKATYGQLLAQRQEALSAVNAKKALLEEQLAALAGDSTAEVCRKDWQQALDNHRKLDAARTDLERSREHAQALRSMIRAVQAPVGADNCTQTASETEAALSQARAEQQQLQLRLGQALGQAENLGQEGQLRARLDKVTRRIARLEDTYHALDMALEALYRATTSLQRRFAPMISKHTQALFGQLTDGRYEQLAMAEDLSLRISAQDEDTLREAQRRSDGTIDQLYLALRLAVARELTPNAPLILDDALVRFDDRRLKKAMEILRQEAKDKQVVLFTCQSREKSLDL